MNDILLETYLDKKTNKAFSFNFESGKIYSIMGLNSSGIDRLFHYLKNGSQTNTVTIDEDNIYNNKELKERICYLKANHRFCGVLKVKDITNKMKKKYLKWDNYFCYNLLKHFDISLNKPYFLLKSYEKSILNAIIMLSSRCNITILDNVLSDCDNKTRYDFYNFLYENHKSYKRTFIISSNYIDEVSYIYDEVLFVDKQKLIASFKCADIKNDFRYLSGKKEVLKSLISGMKVIGYEERDNDLTVCIRKKLSKDDIRKYQKYMIKIDEVPISKVFIYLINLRHRKTKKS